MPTLSRLILRRDQVPPHQVPIRIHGPIWLVGDDVHGLGQLLRDRGIAVEQHEWHLPTAAPVALGGLFFLPGPRDSADVPFETFRWLRAMHEPLRQSRGLLRVVTSAETTATAHAVGGLVKTARHEWPEVSCRIVDVRTRNTAAIVDELLSEGQVETEITSESHRVPHLVAARQPEFGLPLDIVAGALIVITGGARGVTAEAALALARTYRPTLLLLGRSAEPTAEPDWLVPLDAEVAIKRELIARADQRPTPRQIDSEYRRIVGDREIRANLQRLREAGSVVEYRSVDVRDANAMIHVIDEARRTYGPVCGIVHGSGVLADKRIVDKTDEQFRSVYETKVLGLESLLAATIVDPLKFIALFSSSTGRFGRVGQCDYAAANEYLNATAGQLQHERPDCRTVAINWGPWDGGMVTPGLRDVFASEGVGLISQDAGGQFLVAELSADNSESEVVVLGPPPAQPAEFLLSIDNVPPLSDHVLDGKMVLPIALAIEYIAECASRRFPDHRLIGCEAMRVLHPVNGPVSIQVQCGSPTNEDGLLSVPVRIETAARTCYQAKLLLASIPRVDRHAMHDATGPVADCYLGELFHGPAWQGISAVLACDQSGISVVARTSPSPDKWIVNGAIRHWHADPMVIDCVLQAIIVYTQRQYGLPSLPVAIGRLRILEQINPGVVSVDVRVTATKLPMLRASATITDASAQTVATLEDCEYVCAESLRAAFTNNRLPAEARP